MSGVAVRVLLIDNHDSFTFNLLQFCLELGARVVVVASDRVTVEEITSARVTHLVVSPGPGRPSDAGISVELCRRAVEQPFAPLLGVCLGHQALCEAFGARVVSADRVMHGKVDWIHHAGCPPFQRIPQPHRATRYHSLIVETGSLPEFLVPIAHTEGGELMAVRHRELPIFGVQFHPESIASEAGHDILGNFLASEL